MHHNNSKLVIASSAHYLMLRTLLVHKMTSGQGLRANTFYQGGPYPDFIYHCIK